MEDPRWARGEQILLLMLWHCWLGDSKGIWPVKRLVVTIWLELCTSYSSRWTWSPCVVNCSFDGRVVAKLPFVPISWLQNISHRNLLGEDYTDCSFIFLYILCTMSIRQVSGMCVLFSVVCAVHSAFCFPVEAFSSHCSHTDHLAFSSPFSVLTLLVGQQEGLLACTKTGCWFVGADIMTEALHVLQLRCYHHLHHPYLQ